ncbi:MAG: DUF1285 domain-containing protein [Alphaproteobacteria bacterium]|nr:DUF1285 domain-containing protein [Alphaproteobacteria bacterium]
MVKDPEICIAGVFRIDRDGVWYHEGAPVGRSDMVKLFASVLRRDENGDHWLQTPMEKVPVKVEDAPFIAVELATGGSGRERRLRLRTNIGEWLTVGNDHPLTVRRTKAGPRPYVALADGLEARLSRPVYYQLADLAEDGPGEEPGVWSAGCFFPLAPPGAEAGT